MNKSLGQIAFEAYDTHWKSTIPSGHRSDFAAQHSDVRASWEKAAEAVVGEVLKDIRLPPGKVG
jgi:hypothetical protein